MPIGTLIPEWLLSAFALATVFAVMFHLGIALAPAGYRAAWRSPWLMLKGVFAGLVAVPVVVIVVARAFELPRSAEVGMVLMAIAPGAPIALRRALDAGGDRSFAPALQVTTSILAVVTMPLSIVALDEVYAGSADVAPRELARQVFLAQLLPLALGMAARRAFGASVAALEPPLAKLATALLICLVALVLLDAWRPVAGAGLRVALAIAVATLCALGAGHMLGGPAPSTRTAFAVSSASRNAGLAMLVASINAASPAIMATILAFNLLGDALADALDPRHWR